MATPGLWKTKMSTLSKQHEQYRRSKEKPNHVTFERSLDVLKALFPSPTPPNAARFRRMVQHELTPLQALCLLGYFWDEFHDAVPPRRFMRCKPTRRQKGAAVQLAFECDGVRFNMLDITPGGTLLRIGIVALGREVTFTFRINPELQDVVRAELSKTETPLDCLTAFFIVHDILHHFPPDMKRAAPPPNATAVKYMHGELFGGKVNPFVDSTDASFVDHCCC